MPQIRKLAHLVPQVVVMPRMLVLQLELAVPVFTEVLPPQLCRMTPRVTVALVLLGVSMVDRRCLCLCPHRTIRRLGAKTVTVSSPAPPPTPMTSWPCSEALAA